MGYAAPGAVVAVVLSSTFFIKNIYHRHGEQSSSRGRPKAAARVIPAALRCWTSRNKPTQPGVSGK